MEIEKERKEKRLREIAREWINQSQIQFIPFSPANIHSRYNKHETLITTTTRKMVLVLRDDTNKLQNKTNSMYKSTQFNSIRLSRLYICGAGCKIT